MKINKFYKDMGILVVSTLLLMVGANVVSANNKIDVNTNVEIKEIVNTELTKEQALEEILKYNSKVDYEFIGTEQDFETLNEKGFKGYVFLPNVDTDLAYFIDKNTKEIYYYHPSGYMELMK